MNSDSVFGPGRISGLTIPIYRPCCKYTGVNHRSRLRREIRLKEYNGVKYLFERITKIPFIHDDLTTIDRKIEKSEYEKKNKLKKNNTQLRLRWTRVQECRARIPVTECVELKKKKSS